MWTVFIGISLCTSNNNCEEKRLINHPDYCGYYFWKDTLKLKTSSNLDKNFIMSADKLFIFSCMDFNLFFFGFSWYAESQTKHYFPSILFLQGFVICRRTSQSSARGQYFFQKTLFLSHSTCHPSSENTSQQLSVFQTRATTWHSPMISSKRKLQGAEGKVDNMEKRKERWYTKKKAHELEVGLG